MLEAIKNRIIKRITKDSNGFDYTVRELVSMFESNMLTQEWHGQALGSDILNYKTSDTVFILGSGPSVNELSLEDFEKIKKMNSFGFNYSFVLDLVPTIYMYQTNPKLDNLFKARSDEYINTPIFVRGSEVAKGSLVKNLDFYEFLKKHHVYYLNEYPIASKCKIDIDYLLKFFTALDMLTPGHVSKFVPKFRSTIGLLIPLAIQMGYKNIVLVGIDMLNTEHFWDAPEKADLKRKYDLPGAGGLSAFTDVNISPNTVPLYIEALSRWCHEKYGIKMFVSSERSVLYPSLAKFDFDSI